MNDARRSAYKRFVDESPVSDDGYLFDRPQARFLPEPADEIVLVPGATLHAAAAGVRVMLAGGAQLEIAGIDLATLESALRALPCSHARFSAKLGALAPALMKQAFSRILFAPEAVSRLEQQLPSLEIVRFPGSPYEVVRPYWRNMIAVRRALQASAPSTAEQLRALLLELHELALTGEREGTERPSFYLPASLLGRKRAVPGELYEVPTSLERRGHEWILTGGARVSVPLLGGEHYWRLLAESVSDEAALDLEREVELEGLAFGRVLRGRAEAEPHSSAWFLPPRPLSTAHFERLLVELARADAALAAGDTTQLGRALGTFHYCFVRLHPLPSANQSLAMSFVNLRLQAARGVGTPHLLLDQLALRFQLEPYLRLFARALRFWHAPWQSLADRQRQLLTMRSELNAFVSQLGAASSLVEARALLADADRTPARALALLCES